MVNPESLGGRGACVVLFAAATIAAAGIGCAGDPGPVRVNGFSRSSTLGSDLRKVPRGVTVPPPSLGVDLVNGRAVDRAGDAEIVKVGGTGTVNPTR
jgi:hypothetical protein